MLWYMTTIINNNATDVVSGTFVGLPQNSTFSVGNYTFRISYIGGTGNDTITGSSASDSIYGGAGANSGSYTGGQGGYSRIRFTMKKNEEYILI